MILRRARAPLRRWRGGRLPAIGWRGYSISLSSKPVPSLPPPETLAKWSGTRLRHYLDDTLTAAATAHDTTGYHHLLSQLVDVLASRILADPQFVASAWRSLDDTTREMISAPLRQKLAVDDVKLSVFEWIADPASKEARDLVVETLYRIVRLPQTNPKAEYLFEYLDRLYHTHTHNPVPLLITAKLYHRIMAIATPSRFATLFSYLVAANISTKDPTEILRLKKTLHFGTALDRLVGRTGLLRPQWCHTVDANLSPLHQQRMVSFFSLEDLHLHCMEAIRSKKVPAATMYLGMVVKKYEAMCSRQVATAEDLQLVMKAILVSVMEFGEGHQGMMSVLNNMKQNQLPVQFATWLVVVQRLRLRGEFGDALMVINSMALDELTPNQRHQLVREVLLLIGAKYPKQPSVLMGYVVAFYPQAQQLLAQLGVVELVFDDPGATITPATVDASLVMKDTEVPATVVANVYESVLRSLPLNLKPPSVVLDLYQRYRTHIASPSNDRVMVALVNSLLRKSTSKRPSFALTQDGERYHAAKSIASDFFARTTMGRRGRTTSVYDVLITAAFANNDHPFAVQVIKEARKGHVPFTFNQLWPFINFHYQRQEYNTAYLWYRELIASGAKTTAPPAKQLWQMAKRHGWGKAGMRYRQHQWRAAKHTKKQLWEMAIDPVVTTEDRVTHEIIGEASGFSQQLSTLLHDE
ncbi:hypothetical protein DIRU0_A07140 [Diutina rugosa]